jgi:formylglycine-generating enzyme required for sulfatase activity
MTESKSDRARRGACWFGIQRYAQVAERINGGPGNRSNFLGVRLVEEVDEDQTPASGSNRVIRGCSWYDPAQYARVAFRFYAPPADRRNGLGFRLVEVINE